MDIFCSEFFFRLLLLWREMYEASKCLVADSDELMECCAQHVSPAEEIFRYQTEYFYWMVFYRCGHGKSHSAILAPQYLSIFSQNMKGDRCRYDRVAFTEDTSVLTLTRPIFLRTKGRYERALIAGDMSHRNNNYRFVWCGSDFNRKMSSRSQVGTKISPSTV